MKRFFSLLLVAIACVLMADEPRQPDDAKRRAENETQRKAFQGNWEVVSVDVREPLKTGQELPAVGTKLKFKGVEPRTGALG